MKYFQKYIGLTSTDLRQIDNINKQESLANARVMRDSNVYEGPREEI